MYTVQIRLQRPSGKVYLDWMERDQHPIADHALSSALQGYINDTDETCYWRVLSPSNRVIWQNGTPCDEAA